MVVAIVLVVVEQVDIETLMLQKHLVEILVMNLTLRYQLALFIQLLLVQVLQLVEMPNPE